jgi:hypothetical protein
MAKAKYLNIQTSPTGNCHPNSEIEGGGTGKINTTDRLQENMRNPVGFGKTRTTSARAAQESVAHNVRGTHNGTSDKDS